MNTVTWHVQGKIILFDVVQELTIEDLERVNQEINTLLDEGTAPVHIIYQSVGNVKTPTEITRVNKSLTFLQHTNLGWLISVGVNPLITFIGKVVTNLSRINYRAAQNLKEADTILQKVDTSIQST